MKRNETITLAWCDNGSTEGKFTKSIATILLEADEYISEDIVFFRKLKKSGIQAYAHTGALADHIKRVPLNASYYMIYWNNYKENDII